MFLIISIFKRQMSSYKWLNQDQDGNSSQGRREKLWALMQIYDQDPVRVPFIRSKATKWHKLDVSSSIGSIVNLIYITTHFLYPNWLAHTFHVKSTKHIYKIYDPLHLSI